MQNSRSNLLRPVVSLLALLVVALMMFIAPGVAAARQHPLAYSRAILALHHLDTQMRVATVSLRRIEARLGPQQLQLSRASDREHVAALAVNAARAQRAVRSVEAFRAGEHLTVAQQMHGVGNVSDLESRFVDPSARDALNVKAAQAALETLQRQLHTREAATSALRTDRAYARALIAHARSLRGMVLDGLTMTVRADVLASEASFGHHARRKQAATQFPVNSTPLQAPLSASGNGAALVEILERTPPIRAASGIGAVAASIALTQLGRPYHWAGSSPATGFDCSGLVSWAFGKAGVPLPHQSAAIFALGARIPLAQALPGDVVSFGGEGHVGIYLGGGLYVHSPQSGDVVRVENVFAHGGLDGIVRIA